MAKEVYEIAILGKATWNLHSLSNEGTVGNVTEPRTVVLADGRKTDGISGEMLKHIHAMGMWTLESDKNKFCVECKHLGPERANKNPNAKGKPERVIERAIGDCTLCDVHGFLAQTGPTARESTVEFGWAIGIPQAFRDIHVHARHTTGEAYIQDSKDEGKWVDENRKLNCSMKGCDTNEEESKLYKIKGKWYCETHREEAGLTGQMVYHRPTRSGIYAIISVFQPWRIGLNNVNFNYDVNKDSERKSRYQLALKAYQAMFLRTEGAMTTTRLPHTENFEGVIVVSRVNYPAPVISPLKDDYAQEIERIKTSIGDNKIEVKNFTSLAEYVQKINELIDDVPYKVQI
jgi:CRISPR-associated protein Cst2